MMECVEATLGSPPTTCPSPGPRYYAKLYVNGRYVDTSEECTLGKDYLAEFNDIFRSGSALGGGAAMWAGCSMGGGKC